MELLGIISMVVGLTAWAAPLSLCSYISPETTLKSLNLSMSYRYFDDWATPGVDVSGGRAAVDSIRPYESPDFGYPATSSGRLLLASLLPTSGSGDAVRTLRH